jgi:CoA-transferase family III
MVPTSKADGSPQARDGGAPAILATMWRALGGSDEIRGYVDFTGNGSLPSIFRVTDVAVASVAAAGLAIAELVEARHRVRPMVRADRRLASLWFERSIRPQGWTLPPAWDPIAGDYQTADGWIRLHTNAPHHRAAALDVLKTAPDRERIAAAVRDWQADALETAIVENNGCAATMRSVAQWAEHPQGRAVASEPLVRCEASQGGRNCDLAVPQPRPLQGVRVLDLTRVLAGPVATRFLAGFGAQVLRIDPPDWDEPGVVPDVTLGKRCARLDLRTTAGRDRLLELLRAADVFVHGYRPQALQRLGLGSDLCHQVRPGLVEVTLDAYGWTGPWRDRRGFDSLVQMSSGIADAGLRALARERPTPLPVQALDHTTGYLMAAAAVRGLCQSMRLGPGSRWRLSLARTAALLASRGTTALGPDLAADCADDLSPDIEPTEWGPAQRINAPVAVTGAAMRWDHVAGALGRSQAAWMS